MALVSERLKHTLQSTTNLPCQILSEIPANQKKMTPLSPTSLHRLSLHILHYIRYNQSFKQWLIGTCLFLHTFFYPQNLWLLHLALLLEVQLLNEMFHIGRWLRNAVYEDGKEEVIIPVGELLKEEVESQDDDILCGICLESIGSRQIAYLEHCEHIFCGTCLGQWRSQSWHCPSCGKRSIRFVLLCGPMDSVAEKRKCFEEQSNVIYF